MEITYKSELKKTKIKSEHGAVRRGIVMEVIILKFIYILLLFDETHL